MGAIILMNCSNASVPLPIILDKEVREKIATQLLSIRLKVQLLKQEAQEAVNLAKAEIEKILLGGSL